MTTTRVLAVLVLALACGIASAQPVTSGGLRKVTHGVSLSGDGTVASPLSVRDDCASGEIIKWDGAAWACDTDDTIGGGALTGAGTAGTLPKYTAGTVLGDSLLTDSGTSLAYNTTAFTVSSAGVGAFSGALSAAATSVTTLTASGAVTDTGNRVFSVAGDGLESTAATVSINVGSGMQIIADEITFINTVIQSRVSGTCAAGAVSAIASNGTVTCMTGSSDFSISGDVLDLSTAVTAPGTLAVVGLTTVATGADDYLNVGAATTSTSSVNGIRLWHSSSGDNYVDYKTQTAGTSFFRTGGGTDAGSTRTWMAVAALNAAVSFPESAGVTTAGLLTATAGVTSNDQITASDAVGATFIGAAGQGNLKLYDTTATAQGVGGQISFFGNYTGTTPVIGAAIKAMKSNGAAGDYSFDLVFGTIVNGNGDISEGMRLEETGLLTAWAGVTTPLNLTTTGTGDLVSADGLTVANTATFGNATGDEAYFQGYMTRFGVVNEAAVGSWYIYGNQLNHGYATDVDDEDAWINYSGFGLGVTRSRNLNIGDGKNALACSITGSTKSLNCVGGLTENGSAVLSGTIASNTIPKGSSGNLVDSSITDTGTVVTINDATTDTATISGLTRVLHTVGALPTSGAYGLALRDDTAQATGVGGIITFESKFTNGGAYAEGGYIKLAKANGTDGNYSYDMVIATRLSGANLAEAARFGSDKSLAVVGNLSTDANTQLGNASTDSVGVGIPASSEHAMQFAQAAGNKIALYPVDASTSFGFGIGGANNIMYYTPADTGAHSFGFGDAGAMTESQRLDTDGQVWFGDTANSAVSSNLNVLTIGNTGTGQTTDGTALIWATSTASFDTTAALQTQIGIASLVTVSRSAGANPLNVTAITTHASGATDINIGVSGKTTSTTGTTGYGVRAVSVGIGSNRAVYATAEGAGAYAFYADDGDFYNSGALTNDGNFTTGSSDSSDHILKGTTTTIRTTSADSSPTLALQNDAATWWVGVAGASSDLFYVAESGVGTWMSIAKTSGDATFTASVTASRITPATMLNDHTRGFEYFNEFLNVPTEATTTGAGSYTEYDNGITFLGGWNGTNAEANRPGLLTLRAYNSSDTLGGDPAPRYARVITGEGGVGDSWFAGGGATKVAVSYQIIGSLSPPIDNVDSYTIHVGLFDSNTTTGATGDFAPNGIYCRAGNESANWQTCTCEADTCTCNDTSPAVSITEDDWTRCEFTVNAAGTSIAFTVTDTGATGTATHTTNIPNDNTHPVGLGASVDSVDNAGVGIIYVDYLWMDQTFTTAR